MSLRPNQKKKKITVSGTKRKKRFRSTNKTVATVNKKGVVTAKRPGKTSIRVKVGKKTYKCKITVNYAMNRDKMKVAKGDGKQLKIYKVKNVRWSSSDKKVATVNDEGIVIGRKKGKATITGRFGLFSLRSLECKVTVTDTKETQKDSADKKDSANKNSDSSSNTGADEDSTTAVADNTSTNTSSTDKASADSSEAVDDNTSNSAEASTTANITKQGSVDYTGANQETTTAAPETATTASSTENEEDAKETATTTAPASATTATIESKTADDEVGEIDETAENASTENKGTDLPVASTATKDLKKTKPKVKKTLVRVNGKVDKGYSHKDNSKVSTKTSSKTGYYLSKARWVITPKQTVKFEVYKNATPVDNSHIKYVLSKKAKKLVSVKNKTITAKGKEGKVKVKVVIYKGKKKKKVAKNKYLSIVIRKKAAKQGVVSSSEAYSFKKGNTASRVPSGFGSKEKVTWSCTKGYKKYIDIQSKSNDAIIFSCKEAGSFNIVAKCGTKKRTFAITITE